MDLHTCVTFFVSEESVYTENRNSCDIDHLNDEKCHFEPWNNC